MHGCSWAVVAMIDRLCFPLCFGCCRLLWDHFGNDRAKNDPGSSLCLVCVGVLEVRLALVLVTIALQ